MVRHIVVVAALLLGAAAATAEPPKREAGEKSADARDKVICKRFLETGSLVKGQRICRTKAEWDRAREEARASMTQGGTCGASGTTSC